MDDETLKEAWIAFLSSTLGDRPGIVHDANDVTVAKRQWPGPPLVDSSVCIVVYNCFMYFNFNFLKK